jgi:hypothetical protein
MKKFGWMLLALAGCQAKEEKPVNVSKSPSLQVAEPKKLETATFALG